MSERGRQVDINREGRGMDGGENGREGVNR